MLCDILLSTFKNVLGAFFTTCMCALAIFTMDIKLEHSTNIRSVWHALRPQPKCEHAHCNKNAVPEVDSEVSQSYWLTKVPVHTCCTPMTMMHFICLQHKQSEPLNHIYICWWWLLLACDAFWFFFSYVIPPPQAFFFTHMPWSVFYYNYTSI